MKRDERRLRAGVVGTGHMGQYHTLVYAELWDVDLVGLADVDSALVARLAAQYDTQAFTDYRQLFGQVDVLPLGGFDSSCSAMAQGATRRSRGEAYVKYLNEQMGAKHAVQIVSECGHNDRCVYTTDKVLPVIFPQVP